MAKNRFNKSINNVQENRNGETERNCQETDEAEKGRIEEGQEEREEKGLLNPLTPQLTAATVSANPITSTTNTNVYFVVGTRRNGSRCCVFSGRWEDCQNKKQMLETARDNGTNGCYQGMVTFEVKETI